MSQKRLRRFEQIIQLECIIAAMPAYPIYRESEHCYSIYVQGKRHIYPTETDAHISQLRARAAWLRVHDGIGSHL